MTTTEHERPTLNVDLLSKLVTWAAADKAGDDEFFTHLGWPHWDQTRWGRQIINGHCETFCCIAGNAVQQTPGWSLAWTGRSDEHIGYAVPTTTMRTKNGQMVEVIDSKRVGQERTVSEVATETLGLTNAEAYALFDSDNDVADVVFIAITAASVRGVSLDIPEELVNEAEGTRYRYFADDGVFSLGPFDDGDDD